MPTRDPRIDPKAGDRLRMETMPLDFDDVGVEWRGYYPDFMIGYKIPAWRSDVFRMNILLWREWAKNAEVLHVAD